MNRQIKDMMTQLPHTVGHDVELMKAQQMMSDNKCHHLPVLDGGQLVGVLSSRDLELAQKLGQKSEMKVEDIMSDEPVIVDPDLNVGEVVQKMMKENINSVIVRAKPEQAWGIFTSTDALKALI